MNVEFQEVMASGWKDGRIVDNSGAASAEGENQNKRKEKEREKEDEEEGRDETIVGTTLIPFIKSSEIGRAHV